MKIYGLYHTMFTAMISVFGAILMNVLVIDDTSWIRPIYVYIFAFIVFLIFFNLIVIKDERIIIIRPLWFLYRDNVIPIHEIVKANFLKIYHTASSSDEVTFFNKEGYALVYITIYWFDFEVKRLINKLMELGIETTTNFD